MNIHAGRLGDMMAELHNAPRAIPKTKARQPILPDRVKAVLVEVGAKHGFLVEDLQSADQHRPLVRARHEAMYRLWMECRWMSQPAIGIALRRDCKTVLYGIKKHAKRYGLPLKTGRNV